MSADKVRNTILEHAKTAKKQSNQKVFLRRPLEITWDNDMLATVAKPATDMSCNLRGPGVFWLKGLTLFSAGGWEVKVKQVDKETIKLDLKKEFVGPFKKGEDKAKAEGREVARMKEFLGEAVAVINNW
jgi:hypothetical protein